MKRLRQWRRWRISEVITSSLQTLLIALILFFPSAWIPNSVLLARAEEAPPAATAPTVATPPTADPLQQVGGAQDLGTPAPATPPAPGIPSATNKAQNPTVSDQNPPMGGQNPMVTSHHPVLSSESAPPAEQQPSGSTTAAAPTTAPVPKDAPEPAATSEPTAAPAPTAATEPSATTESTAATAPTSTAAPTASAESTSTSVSKTSSRRIPYYQATRPEWGFELVTSLHALGSQDIVPNQAGASVRGVEFQVEYQFPFLQSYGVFSLGPALALYPITPTGSITNSPLSFWSVGGQLRYQARYFREQILVPIGGLDYRFLDYHLASGTNGTMSLTNPFVGAMLLLNILEPSSAAEIYIEEGISRSYLVVEYRPMSGSGPNLTIGGSSLFFGLRLEL